MMVLVPDRPGTRATVGPVVAELQRRGHMVVEGGPADAALVCTLDDAEALHKAGVRPLVYTPQRSNPGRGWARKVGQLARQVDLLLLPGTLYEDLVHLAAPDFDRFRVAGLPRVDVLRAARSTRQSVVDRHGLDSARPLVVFAPRWHERGGLGKPRGHGTLPWLEAVRTGAEEAGAELLVLPHPREHKHKLLERSPHVARVMDATPYLCAADILVADFSPVAAEFTVRERPIIQLLDALAPRLDRLVGPFNPRIHEGFDVGVQVRAADVGPALAAACAGQDEAVERRCYWGERLFAHPGRAAEVHADLLEELTGAPLAWI